MDYKEFLKNWDKDGKTTMATACGSCGLPIEDEYFTCAIPEGGLGRVCYKCYRGINFQAKFFTRLVEER